LRKELKEGPGRKKSRKKERPFQWNFRQRSVMNQSLKQPQKLLVFFLSRTGVFEQPRLLPVVEGNMVFVKGKPYEVNPKAFWRYGKYWLYIIREIDRRPVSNLDYNKIRERGDATDSDEFLIKAAMSARQVDKKPLPNKMILIIVGIIIAAVVIFMFTRGSPPPA